MSAENAWHLCFHSPQHETSGHSNYNLDSFDLIVLTMLFIELHVFLCLKNSVILCTDALVHPLYSDVYVKTR